MIIISAILNTEKDLKFTNFDNTIDLYFHLCIFFDEVSLITMDSDLHAKLFPISLIEDVKDWFIKLPHTSIESFE